ncbi:MAG: TSUP family transporter [Alphaproteobacteria bacterium]|nr:TSUP family transporter [Alphaproteobacteria bacterium]
MDIYFPIAEMPISVPLLLALGGGVGFLSGMFGIGGGFLMTPLLVIVGVPAPVAAASVANQVVGASVSGALAQWRRGNVDVRMAGLLIAAGFVGSAAGVALFGLLRELGQIDLVIAACYVTLLGTLGLLMEIESIRAWRRRRNPVGRRRKLHAHLWIHGLPLKMKFRASRLYISIFAPLSIGFGVGALSGVMGVGGGFVMVPALIYLLDMPTAMAVGTSLLQITVVAANVTFLQSVGNQTVDIMLALLLIVGSVIGAQLGTMFGGRLRGEHLRALLGLIVLVVAFRVAYDLTVNPDELFSLGLSGGRH